jgi:hypothetical protein
MSKSLAMPPPKFFITHSWKDVDFARRLADDLRAHGLDGFFDAYSIKPGDNIAARINKGLVECDVYVPILSYAALESQWCEEEITIALTLSKSPGRKGRPRIVPILIENCQDKLQETLPSLVTRLYISFVGRYNEALVEVIRTGFGASPKQLYTVSPELILVTSSVKPVASQVSQEAIYEVSLKPLGKFAPKYKYGDDTFDTSFVIETPSGKFLGECGIGISSGAADRIPRGVLVNGIPSKVAAFDIWLFDGKQVYTDTIILMSEYTYHDQSWRARLEGFGELALPEKGKHIVLETTNLHLRSLVIDLEYATSIDFPLNSYFRRLSLSMIISDKSKG